MGLAIGAGTALLLRRGPSGDRPLRTAWRSAKPWARRAGRGARWAWDRGADAWERVPREEVEEHVRGYVDSAREALEDFVDTEIKDLRRAVRRQRKKMGI